MNYFSLFWIVYFIIHVVVFVVVVVVVVEAEKCMRVANLNLNLHKREDHI